MLETGIRHIRDPRQTVIGWGPGIYICTDAVLLGTMGSTPQIVFHGFSPQQLSSRNWCENCETPHLELHQPSGNPRHQLFPASYTTVQKHTRPDHKAITIRMRIRSPNQGLHPHTTRMLQTTPHLALDLASPRGSPEDPPHV